MKDYFEFANKMERLLTEASSIKFGAPEFFDGKNFREFMGSKGDAVVSLPKKYSACARKALIFAPHPDDESIVAGLPLRLMTECGFSVCDVAVTLGSNKTRRAGRRAELESACSFLGWNLHICGYENINAKTRAENPDYWNKIVAETSALIESENPAVVFAPHKDDWNKAHVGTSLLVSDALKLLGAKYCGLLIDTEYWRAMGKANILVELTPAVLGAQMTAISCHTKEVERNRYHTRLLAWNVDNVRRGSEILGGQGAESPDFNFGEIYNVRELCGGEFIEKFTKLYLSASQNASKIFED